MVPLLANPMSALHELRAGAWRMIRHADGVDESSLWRSVTLPRPAGVARVPRPMHEIDLVDGIETLPIDDYPRLGAFCELLRAIPDNKRAELCRFATSPMPAWGTEPACPRLPPDARWALVDTQSWVDKNPAYRKRYGKLRGSSFPGFRSPSPGAMGACLAVAAIRQGTRGDGSWGDSGPDDSWTVVLETVAAIGCALVEDDTKVLAQFTMFLRRLGM